MRPVVLVTGGTGFLGAHVVRALVERGERVRVLTRGGGSMSDTVEIAELRDLGVELAQGDVVADLGTPGAVSLARALDGVDRVVHLAGFVSRAPEDGQRMMRVHVDGTRRLYEAAARAGVKRIVVASTSGTIAVSKEAVALDESAPYPIELVGGWPYYLSKIYQEKLALELAARHAIATVVVNPSLLLGPGDTRGSSTGDVKKFLRREIPIVPSGGVNFVDARDAADATVAALERGRPGERYLLGGPNWTFEEFFGRLERASKVRAPRLKVPDRMARAATTLFQHAFEAFHKEPPVDRISVEMSQHYWWCDSGKAERELGFVARDPGETLDETIRDLRRRFL
jgi:dihydroflavonol-4-reductase